MLRSSRLRAFLAVVVPLLITIAAFTAFTYQALIQQQLDLLKARCAVVGSMTGDTLSLDGKLSFHDERAVELMTRRLGEILASHADLRGAAVFDQYGRLIAGMPDQTSRAPLQHGLNDEASVYVRERDRIVLVRDTARVYVPLQGQQDEKPLGTLRLGYDEHELLRPAWAVVRNGLAVGGGTLFVAALAALYLFHHINRRTRVAIGEAVAAALTQENLAARVDPDDASPDLKEATQSINSLLHHYAKQIEANAALEQRAEDLSRRYLKLHQAKDDLLLASQRERNDLRAKIRAMAMLIPHGVLIVDANHRILDANPKAGRLLRLPKTKPQASALPEGLWNLIDSHVASGFNGAAEYQLRYKDSATSRHHELLVRLVPLEDADQSVRRLLVALTDPHEDDLRTSETSHSLIQLLQRSAATILYDVCDSTDRVLHALVDSTLAGMLDSALNGLHRVQSLLSGVSAYARFLEDDGQQTLQICEHLPAVVKRAVESVPRAAVTPAPVVWHEPALDHERVRVPEQLVRLAVADAVETLYAIYPAGRLEVRMTPRGGMADLGCSLLITNADGDLLNALSKEQVEALLEVQGDLVSLRSRLIREVVVRAGGTSEGPSPQHNRIEWTLRLPRKVQAAESQDRGKVEEMVKGFFSATRG